jgi:hypothetical protein
VQRQRRAQARRPTLSNKIPYHCNFFLHKLQRLAIDQHRDILE